VYATDRCTSLDDPWCDRALAVRFHELDAAADAIAAEGRARPFAGLIALGDRPATLAARAAELLGLEFHPPGAAGAAASKLLTRGRFTAAGLLVPWFFSMPLDAPLHAVADRLRFPCVLKPLALSASRGVIRANTADEFVAAQARLATLLCSPEIRSLRDGAHAEILVEGFVPGREYALEGLLERGLLRVLAIFEKPDPLEGPYFEETIYVTPPALLESERRRIAGTIAHAAAALGLWHGPIHAECRVNDHGIFVLEVAARPIGGLCARALRFARNADAAGPQAISFEELLLRHACGETMEAYGRERLASAVMMMPIPGRGYFRNMLGAAEAAVVPGVEDVLVTAKPGQLLVPLPEGGSYLGFIFARAVRPEQAVDALREAYRCLTLELDVEMPLARL
jgi:biotin carboxylase